MNKPVLKDVLPLYTSVSHSRENIFGMVQTAENEDSVCVDESTKQKRPTVGCQLKMKQNKLKDEQ
jgi:hypothetical protein